MTSPIPPQVSLRALREALGLTIEQVAQRIRDQGVKLATDSLNNIELGHRKASTRVLLAYAKALSIEPHHIRQGHELRLWIAANSEQPVSIGRAA